MARPTIYTEERAAEICGYLAIGESLKKACRHKGMPSPSTVFKWLHDYQEFSERYARAKEEAADMFVEDILEIADNAKKDKIPVYADELDENGKKIVVGYAESKTSVQRARVQIDSRKWLAMKLKPKKYGDHLKVDTEGQIVHKYEDMTDEQLEAAIKARENRNA